MIGIAGTIVIAGLPGINAVLEKHRPYMLASREGRPHAPTVVKVGSVRIGGGRPVVIGGPCVIETRDGLLQAAQAANGDPDRDGYHQNQHDEAEIPPALTPRRVRNVRVLSM